MKKIYRTTRMEREAVYDEVWKKSLKQFAIDHSLDYLELSKVLRKENIPYPGSGFWLKKRRGEISERDIKPLPESNKDYVDLPLLLFESIDENKQEESDKEKLNYKKLVITDDVLKDVDEEDRKKVLEAAETLTVNINDELHPILIEYREKVERYREKIKDNPYYYSSSSHYREKPHYIDDLSRKGIDRAILIMNALFKTIEKLGGRIDENLNPVIHSDTVNIRFKETVRKILHIISPEEKKMIKNDWRELKEEQYWNAYGIRKYDEEYTGRLCFIYGAGKKLYDSNKWKIEDRLGEILILLYEEAEIKKKRRLPIEKMQRKVAFYQKLYDDELELRIDEVNKTISLLNRVDDYATACKIRAYIAAEEKRTSPPADPEYIKWAKAKADWYDPSIAYEDPYFGKRKHSAPKELKGFGQYMKREVLTYTDVLDKEEIEKAAEELDISDYMLKYML